MSKIQSCIWEENLKLKTKCDLEPFFLLRTGGKMSFFAFVAELLSQAFRNLAGSRTFWRICIQ
jgi:hypothetical protein